MQKLIKFLISPFTDYSKLYVSVLVIAMVPLLFIGVLSAERLHPILYDMVWSYLIILVVSFWGHFSKKWAGYISTILVVMVSLAMIIILFCKSFCKVYDMFKLSSIVKGTNPEEVSEFFSHYVTEGALSWFCLITVLAFLLILAILGVYGMVAKWASGLKSYYCQLYQSVCVLPMIGIMLLIGWMIHKSWPLTFPGTPYNVIYYSATIFVHDPQMEPANVELEIVDKTKTQVENIVVIIGESLSRTHMDIYGYPLPTTSYMRQMEKDSLLVVFENPIASAPTTADSFKDFMTISRLHGKDYTYYNAPNWITILRQAGYYSTWMSNQSKIGAWDNVCSQYGRLSDRTLWLDENYSFGYTEKDTEGKFDDRLIALRKSIEEDATDRTRHLDIYHLMGSHPDFDKRYPKTFCRFSEKDYPDHWPAFKRKHMSFYDNSVAYNDSVVAAIMRIYQEKDAIVVYFSDHSLDIYQSSDDYCGHAHAHPEFGEMIPFVVYMTDKFRSLHPALVSNMYNNRREVFKTTDLTYFLMDFANVRIIDKRNR